MVVNGVEVRGKDGLYCLNDIHRASGGSVAKKIREWLKLASTKRLIEYLSGREFHPGQNCCCIQRVQEGRSLNTYADKIVVYSYAMWVDISFHVAVVEAFDALVSDEIGKAREIAVATQYKADVLDKMCHKGSSYSITEAAMEVAKITGLRLTAQDLNRILAGEGIHKENWYKAKGCKRAFRQAVVDRGYGTYSFVVDGKGNKHRCDRLTSKGIQYIANWLMKYFFVFPQRQKQQLQPTFDPSEILITEMSRGASC